MYHDVDSVPITFDQIDESGFGAYIEVTVVCSTLYS